MHIVIIGNGISGITAARFIRKLSDHQITVISSESDYFFSRTALMYIYMGHMTQKQTRPYEDGFWKKNRIDLMRARVTAIDVEGKQLNIDGSDAQGPISYDKLIIASGSIPSFYNWPGQDLDGVRGLYSLQDLQYLEDHSKGLEQGVIVGGGLIGIELAEMLLSRGMSCKMLVREESYWSRVLPPEESAMVTKHIRHHKGMDLRLNTELKEILADDNGRCRAVITDKGEEIPCQYVGITTGVRPNIDWMRDQGVEIDRGVLVNEHLMTNVSDIYAIGDCAQLRQPAVGRRPIEAVWYTGRMMGETVAHTICGQQVSYDPGIWFNSAKFFHIEYQIYGDVPASLPEGSGTLYAELGERSIRLNYDLTTMALQGVHVMGTRFRHEVCEHWIKHQVPLKEVVTKLDAADFDPEFYKSIVPILRAEYEAEFNDKVSPVGKRSWWSARRLLQSS